MTCGVSMAGFDETSLHVIVEKDRQGFPDVLQQRVIDIEHHRFS